MYNINTIYKYVLVYNMDTIGKSNLFIMVKIKIKIWEHVRKHVLVSLNAN